MLKALFKKEVLRLLSSLAAGRKGPANNKKKKVGASSKGAIIGFVVLWAFVLFSLAMAFLGMCDMLGQSLIPLGLDWLYYCLVGVFAIGLSIIGNSFTASSIIFKARDNELLLSMPIPPAYILASRTMLIFAMSVLFAAVPMVPALIQNKFIAESISINVVICVIVLIICIGLIVTAISALLGWLLAFLGKHIKRKSLATTAFMFVFLGAYYYFYFNINKYLTKLTESSLEIGGLIESNLFARPVYSFGLAASGDFKALGYFFVFSVVIFAVVYFILTRNLEKILTMSDAGINKTFDAEEQSKQEAVVQKSPKKALLKKEFDRFLASPSYMINCGFGIILLIGATVFVLIKAKMFGGLMEAMNFLAGDGSGSLSDGATALMAGGGKLGNLLALAASLDKAVLGRLVGAAPLLILLFAWGLAGTCATAAASVGIEGKNLWILKVLPVNTMDVLNAKCNMQILLTAPVAFVFILASGFALGLDLSQTVFLLLVTYLFIRLHASCSLLMGLVNPKLDWTNENVPVKQSVAVLIAFIAGPLAGLLVGAAYVCVLYRFVPIDGYLAGLIVVLALLTRFTIGKLYTKGVAMYESL